MSEDVGADPGHQVEHDATVRKLDPRSLTRPRGEQRVRHCEASHLAEPNQTGVVGLRGKAPPAARGANCHDEGLRGPADFRVRMKRGEKGRVVRGWVEHGRNLDLHEPG